MNVVVFDYLTPVIMLLFLRHSFVESWRFNYTLQTSINQTLKSFLRKLSSNRLSVGNIFLTPFSFVI